MARDLNVFISHSWDHSDDLMKLKNLLEARKYFKVNFTEASKDEPIDSTNSAYIKKRLKVKINSSNIMLGLAGIYASHSDWMEWELEQADNSSIPIVGVIPRGKERISRTVSKRSKENVRWNTESIVEAIRRHAK